MVEKVKDKLIKNYTQNTTYMQKNNDSSTQKHELQQMYKQQHDHQQKDEQQNKITHKLNRMSKTYNKIRFTVSATLVQFILNQKLCIKKDSIIQNIGNIKFGFGFPEVE